MNPHSTNSQERSALRVGSLVRRLPIRVVNMSAAGCLLESAQPVDTGTVALLALQIGDRRYVDPVRITRSVQKAGGVWVYGLGAEMLTLSPPSEATLRRVALLEDAELVISPPTASSSSAEQNAADRVDGSTS
jgi:hypothetical protein